MNHTSSFRFANKPGVTPGKPLVIGSVIEANRGKHPEACRFHVGGAY